MAPAAEKRVIKTNTADVWLDEEGIVWIENHVPAITQKEVEENFQAVWEIGGHIQRPVINLIEGITLVDKETRDYGAGEDAQRILSAMALVAKNRLSVVVGNFFINVSNPTYPTKLFTSQAAALEWLEQFAK
ncbi:MAG: hypothetical protein OEY93_09160 [Anaerolineae bacterium]|nr:hypothetical protein [Anaerolineae bacterium]